MKISILFLYLLLPSFCSVTLAQSEPKAAEPGFAPGKFVDITDKSGVQFKHMGIHTSRKYLIETMGSGVALLDYDNDGLLDIFLVNVAQIGDPTPKGTNPKKTGPEYWNRLYHQKKDGTFEDVTEKAGLQGIGYGMGVAVGDFDNDGYEDIYVTNAVGGNILYHNQGNGTFKDVTASSGTRGDGGWSSSAAWVDLDNDGLLDLIVLRYMKWDFDDIWCGERKDGARGYCHPDVFAAEPPLVFHNDGNGKFTEVGQKIGIDKPGKGLGISIADYDRDGHIDVLVANDAMVEHLYHNKGDGSFEEVGLLSEMAVDGDGRTYSGMGTDFADYKNDGWPDIVITDLANQKYALYDNNKDGTFTYATYTSGLGGMTLLHSGWGIKFMDYDNDGLKDLLIVQGHDMDNIELNFPQLRYKEPIMLARNTGHGFVSGGFGGIFDEAWVGRGLAVGDLDNDGRLDAIVTTNGGPAHVLHNETAAKNRWLLLNLVGHKSNRDAIGAVVKLTTSRGSQYVTVSTTGSYQSANDKRVHFGMGSDAIAKSIEIRWPSGIVQTLKEVRADQVLKIDEPVDEPPKAAGK
jgi:enediyne biosynthesis protein E4